MEKNNGYFTCRPIQIFERTSFNFSWNEMFFRQMLKINSKHTFYVQYMFFENRVVYEIMWEKSTAQRGTSQMTARRMRIACLIPKATNTQTQVVHYSLLFHSNNGCTNVPQCYVTACLVYYQQLNVNNTAGTTQCNFGFHKMRGISLPAEKLLASPAGLCYKESVGPLYLTLFNSEH